MNETQKNLWTVPGTKAVSGIQILVCDGAYAYSTRNEAELLRIELLTGRTETLFTADRMMCGMVSDDASKNLVIAGQEQLYFLAKVRYRIGLYRVDLSTRQVELLHNEIPGNTLPHTLELQVPWHTQDAVYCIYLNPEIQPLVLDTIQDPNSPYRAVFSFDVDSREEPVSVDLRPLWDIPDLDTTMRCYRELDFLIIQLQDDHDILSKIMVNYNFESGTVTEALGWAKPYGDFAPYIE